MTLLQDVRVALDPYVDIPFNAYLAAILLLTHRLSTRHPVTLTILVYTTSIILFIYDRTSKPGEWAKLIALLPLGLGSVLIFTIANPTFKKRWLSAFTNYINFAVYGNIVMMVATPAGGTLRGLCGKIACIALSIWIVQQGYLVRWKTVRLHNNLFVFTAVSKSWIYAHAIYRFVLLTLPCFGSGRRHRLLEVYSLLFTYALSKSSGLPFEHCFGMADTLVVPANAAWSAMVRTFGLVPTDARYSDPASAGIGPKADVCLSALSLSVAVFAFYKVLTVGSRAKDLEKRQR